MNLMMVVFGPIAGILARRSGPKLPMVLGTVAVTAGFVVPAVSHAHVWQVLASGLLVGAGIGLAFAGMANAIIGSVPATQTGEATSVNTISRTIGSSIGTAVIAAVIASGVSPQGLPADSSFTTAFWLCAGVAALSVVAALLLPALRHDPVAQGADTGADVTTRP